MAHDHDHHHGGTYYVDQLCTIATCGALGIVAILMYRGSGPSGQPKLSYILAPQFFVPVLVGGIALLVLVTIRAITLWRQAGEARSCDHSHCAHDHGHDHGDGHAHAHDHAHDHSHDHGWTPLRYAVLMIPIALFLLNLPNSSFSAEKFGRDLHAGAVEGATGLIGDKGQAYHLGFRELTQAAFFPDQRAELEGKTGRLRGMFSPISEKEFTLFRVKMNCCAADAIPVGVRIITEEPLAGFRGKDWVEVEGQIQFRKLVGQDKYLPVLVVPSPWEKHIRTIPPQPDYGLE
mgnify:FL=1